MLNPRPASQTDPEELRRVMRRWVSGVTVVTSRLGELCHGMTVSSFTSVSLTPPLVLVSLQRDTRTFQLIQQAGVFGVTLLSQHQQEASDCFAGRTRDHEADRFEGFELDTLVTGAPFLRGGLAYIDCFVQQMHDTGTSTLVIGEVVAEKQFPGGAPLVYTNQSYHRLQD